jgi:hypothetical protein
MTNVTKIDLYDGHGKQAKPNANLADVVFPYKDLEKSLGATVMEAIFEGYVLENWDDGGINAGLFFDQGAVSVTVDLLCSFTVDVDIVGLINDYDGIYDSDGIDALKKIAEACNAKLLELKK